MTKYFKDIFPYAEEKGSGMTMEGFRTHRFGHQRKAYAQVLAATDDQLVDSIRKMLPIHAVNFCVPEKLAEKCMMELSHHLKLEIDKIIELPGVAMQRSRDFYAGFNAGLTAGKNEE